MFRLPGLVMLGMLLLLAESASGQQMLILRKGKVIARFNPGDDIFFQLKDQRQLHHSTIQAVREFYFTTVANDTIQFSRVASVTFRNDGRKKYGMATAIGGLALLGVYGLNSLAFDEDSSSMRGLRVVGIFGVGFGMFIYLTSENSVKMNGVKRLKYVSYDSPLYR